MAAIQLPIVQKWGCTRMWIEPFLAGVLATILVELVLPEEKSEVLQNE